MKVLVLCGLILGAALARADDGCKASIDAASQKLCQRAQSAQSSDAALCIKYAGAAKNACFKAVYFASTNYRAGIGVEKIMTCLYKSTTSKGHCLFTAANPGVSTDDLQACVDASGPTGEDLFRVCLRGLRDQNGMLHSDKIHSCNLKFHDDSDEFGKCVQCKADEDASSDYDSWLAKDIADPGKNLE